MILSSPRLLWKLICVGTASENTYLKKHNYDFLSTGDPRREKIVRILCFPLGLSLIPPNPSLPAPLGLYRYLTPPPNPIPWYPWKMTWGGMWFFGKKRPLPGNRDNTHTHTGLWDIGRLFCKIEQAFWVVFQFLALYISKSFWGPANLLGDMCFQEKQNSARHPRQHTEGFRALIG